MLKKQELIPQTLNLIPYFNDIQIKEKEGHYPS